jgi:hypothetical protein
VPIIWALGVVACWRIASARSRRAIASATRPGTDAQQSATLSSVVASTGSLGEKQRSRIASA